MLVAMSATPENSSNNPAVKWNQHPVISTVLWMLGTDQDSTQSSDRTNNAGSSNGKLNGLKWKDERGGSINEYFSQIQHQPSTDTIVADKTQTQLHPGASLHHHTSNTDDLTKYCTSQSTALPNRHECHDRDSCSELTPSPQWGFYVPITPPQQEMFHAHAEAHSNSNAPQPPGT